MSVRIGNNMSTQRNIHGGSPQGSILGNYLFCITTDNLAKEHDEVAPLVRTPAVLRRNRQRSGPMRMTVASGTAWAAGGARNPGPSGLNNLVDRDVSNHHYESSGPDTEDSDGEHDFRFFRFRDRLVFDSSDEDIEVLEQEEIDYVLGVPQEWEERDLMKCIYIDDYNCVEKVRQRDAVFHLTEEGRTTITHAIKSQATFNKLKKEASEIGMVINDKKHNYFVSHPPITCVSRTYPLTMARSSRLRR